MASSQPPPTRLGRYEILEEIGKGAMGVVYLARDPLIGRRVAIKTFRVGWASREEDREQMRARFIREAQSAGILSHPSIVTIHDIVEQSQEGLTFIAMEYVPGTNLKEVLAKKEPLSLDFVVDVVSQVAAALDYAHGRGIIHRDIKPGNLLISLDHQVKITDFGIARGAIEDITNLTAEGQIVGTPNYMAPEQVLGREIDHRADIFSLGVVLYEMLTLKKPFSGDSAAAVTHRIAYDPHPPARDLVPELPEKIDEILAIALEKEASRRYARAGDLGEELRRAVPEATEGDDSAATQEVPELHIDEEIFKDVEPVVASPAGEVRRAPGGEGRGRRAAVGIAAAALWVMVAAASGSLWLAAWGGEGEGDARFEETYDRLVAGGQELLLEGDPEGAAELFALAADVAPADWWWVVELEREARRQAAMAAEIAADRERHVAAIAAAEAAFEEEDLERAQRLTEEALERWPGDLAATRLAARLPRPEEPAPAAREPTPRETAPAAAGRPAPEPEPPAPPAQAEAPEPEPPPVLAEPVDVDLAVDFLTEISEGILTIYADERQILREEFHFYRRAGLFRREGTAGRIQGDLSLRSGRAIFRVYLVLPDRPTITASLEADLAPHRAHTLRIILREDHDVQIELL